MTPAEKENTKDISATEYVRTNFRSSDRLAVLVRNRNRGETIQRITTSARIVEPAFQEWLHFKNENESCDIYIGMNTLKPEARTRTKEDIHTIRHLYLDVDHDGPAALTKIQESNLVPSPNYTLSTSPDKFQVVWRVESISPEQAEVLQRAMARKFGGDPAATDSTRVLRLPGFLNKKYDTEFRVHAQKHTDHMYHLQDFRLRTEPIESHFRPRLYSQTLASSEPRQLSQSEHDWDYAKHAFSSGIYRPS
jgi:RepB DNA-primase from phage plasmid